MIPETSETNKESPTMMAPSFFQEVLSDHSVGWKTKHTLAITLSLKKKKKTKTDVKFREVEPADNRLLENR